MAYYDDLIISGYPGAKNKTAVYYLMWIPYKDIDTYIEPFGGVYGVGLKKDRHPVEIYNDIDKELCALFKVLSDEKTGEELLEKMMKVTYCEETFDNAKKQLKENTFDDDVQKAVMVWCTLLMSYNGMRDEYSKKNEVEATGKLQSLILKKTKLLPVMKNLVVKNIDALDLINEYKNDERTFMFIDPPYTEKNKHSDKKRKKIYNYEMLENKEHERFLEIICNAKAKILVCSYENELYNNFLCAEHGWKKIDVALTYKSLGARKNRYTSRAVESIYINYDIQNYI